VRRDRPRNAPRRPGWDDPGHGAAHDRPRPGAHRGRSWVVAAYVVAAAAATPLCGKLGDRLGRKRLLELSLATFLLASALCGVAQSLTMLIVARTVQGVAAGGLMSLAMAAVGDLVDPRERGRYQGYVMSTFAVATVAGPLVGGLLVDEVSWRWVFYVNLPVGIAALVGLRTRLPAPPVDRPAHGLDVAGAALLAAATCTLLLAYVWGGERYAWDSATILGLLAATGVLAAALVVRERRVADRSSRSTCCARAPCRSPAPRCSSRRGRSSRSTCSCRCSCRSRPARRRPRPGCCSCR
jgi:multidrug resistance protein